MKIPAAQRLLLALCALTALAQLPAAAAASKLTPEVALQRVRANSRPDDFNSTIARLGRLLPASQVADWLGRAAAGPCGGSGDRPAIVRGGLWPNGLLHGARLAECLRPEPPPMLLTVVSEATPAGAQLRWDVRRTWGSRRGVALAFFLGRAGSDALQAGIDAEARRYRDLVQFQMPEGPAWGTRRHLATIEWALAHCPGARHLVHVKDSVFVDTTHLAAYLASSPPPGLLCPPRRNEAPQRSRASPWFISVREFPGGRYPDFCNTAAYVLGNATALRLLVCAALKRPLWIDDVYVTGVLRAAADAPLTEFPAGHGFGRSLPSDSRAWGPASDYMFLDSDHPEFIGVYWPGLWRSLLLRECSNMIF